MRTETWASQPTFNSFFCRDVTHRSMDTFSIGPVELNRTCHSWHIEVIFVIILTVPLFTVCYCHQVCQILLLLLPSTIYFSLSSCPFSSDESYKELHQNDLCEYMTKLHHYEINLSILYANIMCNPYNNHVGEVC